MELPPRHVPIFQVCLVREGGSQEYGFPQGRASLDQEPAKVAVEVLRQATNLTGKSCIVLKNLASFPDSTPQPPLPSFLSHCVCDKKLGSGVWERG